MLRNIPPKHLFGLAWIGRVALATLLPAQMTTRKLLAAKRCDGVSQVRREALAAAAIEKLEEVLALFLVVAWRIFPDLLALPQNVGAMNTVIPLRQSNGRSRPRAVYYVTDFSEDATFRLAIRYVSS